MSDEIVKTPFATYVGGRSTAGTPYGASDYIPLVRNGVTYKVPASTLGGSAPALLSAHFSGEVVIPYVEPDPQGMLDFTDDFSTAATFTTISGDGAGSISSFTVSGNVGTVSTSGAITGLFTQTSHSLTAPQFFIEITVPSAPSGTPTTYSTVGVGIAKNINEYLAVLYDRLTGNFWIRNRTASGTYNDQPVVNIGANITAPYKIGISLVGNSVCSWYNKGDGWVYAAKYNAKAHRNFETSGTLTGYKACFEISSGGSSSTWNVSNFKCGRFGGIGMRDMAIVINENGSPWAGAGGNTVYFCASCADPSGYDGATSELGGTYLGVFTLNLDTLVITQTGAIFVDRSSKITNDHAGQIIAYDNGDRRLLVSSWGTGYGSLQILHKLIANGAQPDILTAKMSVVSSMTALSLPLGSAGTGCYDPFLVYETANSRWLLAYTITDGFPSSKYYAALASCPDIDSPVWTSIGADSNNKGWEGTKILVSEDDYFIVVGGPAPSGSGVGGYSTRVYDTTMTFAGRLAAMLRGNGGSTNGGTNPHPMVFEHPNGQYLCLLTFDASTFPATDATNTWGQPILQFARQ